MTPKILETLSLKLNLLRSDMEGIINYIDNNQNKEPSRKSLEPLTRLRKSSKELEDAQNENPHLLFIKDKLEDIFKGA